MCGSEVQNACDMEMNTTILKIFEGFQARMKKTTSPEACRLFQTSISVAVMLAFSSSQIVTSSLSTSMPFP